MPLLEEEVDEFIWVQLEQYYQDRVKFYLSDYDSCTTHELIQGLCDLVEESKDAYEKLSKVYIKLMIETERLYEQKTKLKRWLEEEIEGNPQLYFLKKHFHTVIEKLEELEAQ